MAGWLTAVRSSFSLGPEGCGCDQASGEVGWVDGSGEPRCAGQHCPRLRQQQPPQQCPTHDSRRSTYPPTPGSSSSGGGGSIAHPQRRRPAGRSPGCRRRAQTAAWRRARPQPPPWPCPRSGGGEGTGTSGQSAGERMGCSSCWGSFSCEELHTKNKLGRKQVTEGNSSNAMIRTRRGSHMHFLQRPLPACPPVHPGRGRRRPPWACSRQTWRRTRPAAGGQDRSQSTAQHQLQLGRAAGSMEERTLRHTPRARCKQKSSATSWVFR